MTDLPDLSLGLDREVLAAILHTLPVELSFVDADDTVRYFSHEGKAKIFDRQRAAIGRKVQQCHPRWSLDEVEGILDDLRSGRADVSEFWIRRGGRTIHIRYFAVRDRAGAYLGSLEVVQDITDLQRLEGERRFQVKVNPDDDLG